MIERRLARKGLRIRGSINPAPGDDAPDGIKSLLLIGYLGGEMWPAFLRERQDEPDPLDAWTRRLIDPLAKEAGAVALYPFVGPPWLPFQRWAMQAESLTQSPVGPLIHPEYGLWHGYRAALGFKEELPVSSLSPIADTCAACRAKPCLAACPAGVFASGRYDVPACANHLKTPVNDCLKAGCLARRACPIGGKHAYGPDQASFHTRAFLNAMDSFL